MSHRSSGTCATNPSARRRSRIGSLASAESDRSSSCSDDSNNAACPQIGLYVNRSEALFVEDDASDEGDLIDAEEVTAISVAGCHSLNRTGTAFAAGAMVIGEYFTRLVVNAGGDDLWRLGAGRRKNVSN